MSLILRNKRPRSLEERLAYMPSCRSGVYNCPAMRSILLILLLAATGQGAPPPRHAQGRRVLGALVLGALAPRQHTVLLGRWRTVEIRSESGPVRQERVRELIIDGRVREYTTGMPHDVTEHLFVVRRAYRINDALPEEAAKTSRWVWRLGGWMSVDRQTGRIAQLNLPGFDSEISEASWYRDYAAFCGVSDDGSKNYMVVAQLGKRKPILKRESASGCDAPRWEREPSRVTFLIGSEKTTFAVHARGADLQPESAEEEGPQ